MSEKAQEQGMADDRDDDEAAPDASDPKPADEETGQDEGQKGREHLGHEAQWIERQVDPAEARDPRDDTPEDETGGPFPSLGPVS